MSEKTEITFMQTRLIRLASEEWHLPVEQIIHLFKEADVLGYIEKCYGIFHCEGDEAVLEDITEFLQRNGKVLYHCRKDCGLCNKRYPYCLSCRGFRDSRR